MIKEKDVINLKVPFPDISSGLARGIHMYICVGNNKEALFVKSQTYKPRLLTLVNNSIIEEADINRNPFSQKTLIDLDKEFHISKDLVISKDSLCRKRPDVCDELFAEINQKIIEPNHEMLNEQLLLTLNPEYLSTR